MGVRLALAAQRSILGCKHGDVALTSKNFIENGKRPFRKQRRVLHA